MVREPDILWWTTTSIPGHLDGLSISTPVGSGTEKHIHSYKESGTRSSTAILPSRRRPATDVTWRVISDIRATAVTHRPDGRGGRGLRRCFIGRQLDAVVPTSRHPRRDTTGGIRDGHQCTGRCFPRCYDATRDAGESSSATPGGRPAGCLYTTARDITTFGAWPVHRDHESIVADRPTTYGPAVATYRRSCLLVAGGRSPPYSSGRQPRRPCRASEPGRTPTLRGRPRGAHRQLRVCRRRRDRPDVTRNTSPSGGGNKSGPRRNRQFIIISFVAGHISKNCMCGCPVTQWLHRWRYPDIYFDIYIATGSIFTDFDHIIICILYQVLYVQIEHQD